MDIPTGVLNEAACRTISLFWASLALRGLELALPVVREVLHGREIYVPELGHTVNQ